MNRFRFGSFVVDADTVEVIGPDGVREVEPQVFRVLQYLVEQRGRLVTKEELLDNVWGDRFVVRVCAHHPHQAGSPSG